MKAADKHTLNHIIKRFTALAADMQRLQKNRRPEHAGYLNRACGVCEVIIQTLTALDRQLD